MISKNIRTKKTKPNKTKHSKKKNKNLKGGTKKRSNKLKRQNNKVIKGGKKYKLSKLQKGGGCDGVLSSKSIQILEANSRYVSTLNFIAKSIQKLGIKDRLCPELYKSISEVIIEYKYKTFDYEIIKAKIKTCIETFRDAYLTDKKNRQKLNPSFHNNDNEVTLDPFLNTLNNNTDIENGPIIVPLNQQSKNRKNYQQSNVQQYPKSQKPIYGTIKDVEELNGISNPFYAISNIATTHKVDTGYAEIDPRYATVDEIDTGYAEIDPGSTAAYRGSPTVEPQYATIDEIDSTAAYRGSPTVEQIYSKLKTPTTVERGTPVVKPIYSKLKTSTTKLTSDITAKPK